MRKFKVTGVDCPSCAARIERRLRDTGLDATIDFDLETLIMDDEAVEDLHCLLSHHAPEISIVEPSEGEKDFPFRGLLRLASSITLFVVALLFSPILHGRNEFFEYSLFVIAYLVSGGNVVFKALKNLLRGDFFDENFLMTVATLGAFMIHELPEAVAVMIFYSLGELLESLALRRSRRSVKELIDLRADNVNHLVDGRLKTLPAKEVKPGDRFVVRVGDRIPIDGVICSGRTLLDKSLLTGESVLVSAAEGDVVLAGTINKSGVIEIVATMTLEKSYTSRMLELVQEGSIRKSNRERFITRFSRFYTPVVVLIALFVATIPPLLFGEAFSEWFHKAFIILVISCPCALIISVPLSYFVGIGRASREGILFKGSSFLESLGQIDSVFFDKTGTLTEGRSRITGIESTGRYDKRRVVQYAALLESYSTHPVAIPFTEMISDVPKWMKVSSYSEVAGSGIVAEVNGKRVAVGNKSLLNALGVGFEEGDDSGRVFLVIDERIEGVFTLSDTLRNDSSEAIAELRKLGIKEIVMLTGDHSDRAASISTELQLDGFISEATPEDKMRAVESAIKSGKRTAFVGDGINDAPVIARADVGIAMGSSGADAAIETADVVLSGESLSKVARAIEISRSTNRNAAQNIAAALGVKLAFIALGAFGLMNMWGAVFADVGVTLLAVFNSVRMLNK
ncbi:MAG: cadmium-translocating P-type ATPase [Kosmotogaceae bacterium]|nr:cadmium-translocating P-type ATPase [Kosmotogaceae bacterium]